MYHLFKQPKGRRYSPGLLSVASIWHNVSSGLYEQIYTYNAPSLPSLRYLSTVSSVINVETGLITFIHDKLLKITNLKSREKKCKNNHRRD
uniref:Uncharacterized protein n=1 Tax=Lepeophtheirus salmonis TaxID=72036 RepID=A0A0K2VKB9_LEPSM